MEILDFASVMVVLQKHVSNAGYGNQVEFFVHLFAEAFRKPLNSDHSDAGQISKWINGKEKLSGLIIDCYRNNENQKKLSARIREMLLPYMPDSTKVIQELYDLLMRAPNVSGPKKMELTDGYEIVDDYDKATFITDLICLGMQLPFVKRDAQGKPIMPLKNLSPAVVGYILDTEIPRPCLWFLGRQQELERLHELLMEHSKVFLHGIPGIGKSELAKAYGKRYAKEYTNIIYIYYPGDLKKAVTNLMFTDDRTDESDDLRFMRHRYFLRSLQEDTLLIVDNFNATPTQDPYLDEMLGYRCRIIFTTRSRYEDETTQEVTEMDGDTLLELVGKFYPDAQKHQREVRRIIELLHGNTFVVELAARLLKIGMLKPRKLRQKLEKEKTALDVSDKIGTKKDGKSRKATYYEHIHTLFSLYGLSKAEKGILRGMTMMPAKGIPAFMFAEWMGQKDMNVIHDLMEMGFLHPKNDRDILLHPMIREIVLEELKPTVSNTAVLLENLQMLSLNHGWDYMDYKQLFYAIESIIEMIGKDDVHAYLRFLENVFQYMEKYRYETGMQRVIDEMEALLSDDSVGTSADRACLLDCRAALEKDPEKQIELEQKAILMLGEICSQNALLAANLYANLGRLYNQTGRMELAKKGMEYGIDLMEEYGLLQYHDTVVQNYNYAALLAEMGRTQEAYSRLSDLAEKVQENNSDDCLDYAMIRQLQGDVCVILGYAAEAKACYQKAMEIYELAYEDEPELLREKYREIHVAVRTLQQKKQELPV